MEVKTMYYTINEDLLINESKCKILDYLKEKFKIDITSYMLILNNLLYFFNNNDYTYETYHEDVGFKIYVKKYLFDLVKILNDSGINISISEMIENNLLEVL